jgi:hypothetical protein
VGQPAEFRFFTSTARKNDKVGDLIEDYGDQLEELSPMEVSFPAGEVSSEVVPVSFETAVTETGVLQRARASGACGARRPPVEARIQRAGEGNDGVKVGIDLGTTNSALAYIDEREGDDREFPPLHIFETPQLVAAGRIEPRARCPRSSFWKTASRWACTRASRARLCPRGWCTRRNRGLSNPDVDRTAKILPWDSQETGRVLSPVEVSARFIGKFREEWDRAMGAPLAEQDIVLTVPASFDEEARELTVMAARDAGLEKADAAGRAGGGLLFVDREQPGAIAQEALRWPDGAGVRRGRRHQRFQPDSRLARGRPGELHAHRGGQAPAAGRRQSGSHAHLAGGDQARRRRSPCGSAADCGGSARRPRRSCSTIRI